MKILLYGFPWSVYILHKGCYHLSWIIIWCLHKIPQLFWLDFVFFFFCLGGWSTTLMAASKTALTFCAGIAQQMVEKRGYIYIYIYFIITNLIWIWQDKQKLLLVSLSYIQHRQRLQSVFSVDLPAVTSTFQLLMFDDKHLVAIWNVFTLFHKVHNLSW